MRIAIHYTDRPLVVVEGVLHFRIRKDSVLLVRGVGDRETIPLTNLLFIQVGK